MAIFVAGNPDGSVTMVEFFDYNCGFCKRAMSDVLALVESDQDLRVVLKEWPILSARDRCLPPGGARLAPPGQVLGVPSGSHGDTTR
jgi:hypothetical protein